MVFEEHIISAASKTPQPPEEIHSNIKGFYSTTAMELCLLVCGSGLLPNKDDQTSFLEIGIFQGKSFIILSNALNTRCAEFLAVDAFGTPTDDHLVTGSAARQRFEENLDAYSVLQRIRIYEGFSSDLGASDVGTFGKIGFGSVDGSHSFEDTLHDMTLVGENLHPDGVMIVDDVFHSRFIEVAWGVHEFLSRNTGIVPWLVGGNKVFFAHAAKAEELRSFVDASKPLNLLFLEKRLFGHPVIVAAPLDDRTTKRQVAYQVRHKYPRLYGFLKTNRLMKAIYRRL